MNILVAVLAIIVIFLSPLQVATNALHFEGLHRLFGSVKNEIKIGVFKVLGSTIFFCLK